MAAESPDDALAALPASYDAWRRSTLGRITDALEERLLLDRIGPPAGLRVLDVGCGDGVMAVRLAAAGAHVTGLDASAAMLAAARHRAGSARVALDLVRGDAAALPFADGSFDRVVSVATLCFSADPARAIGEMARVLTPGGRLVLGELARWSLCAAQRRLKGWLGSAVWRAAHFRSRGELIALAGAAGLRDAAVAVAVFYPPIGLAAQLMAPLDPAIGRWTSLGAAFLVLSAARPPYRLAPEIRA
jgi:ubiquinone/menaquinone biosynthesis C-methylase UbiE